MKEEIIGVYAQEDCDIPSGTGKYIPVQTSREIRGEVLIQSSKKTIQGFGLSRADVLAVGAGV